MKQAEFAKTIQPVKDLLKLADSYITGNVGEWVGAGLMTESEFQEWRRVGELESQMYHVGRDAEDSIPRPDCFDQYPKEYQDILRRLAELEPDVNLIKGTREMLRSLTSNRGNQYGDRTTRGSRLGIDQVADQVFAFFESLPGEDMTEYSNLKAAQERRSQREGTIVRRINHASFDAWDAQKREARAAAMGTFRLEHKADFELKARIDSAVERRRKDKIQEIGRWINAALVKAMAARKRGSK